MTKESELLTVREAAEVLRCSLRTLYSLLDQGEIQAFRLGGGAKILFKPEHLEAALQPYEKKVEQ